MNFSVKHKSLAGLLPFLCTCVLALFFTSCNVTKYLPEGEYLYNGSAVKVAAPNGVSTNELELAVNGVLDNTTNNKLPVLGYYEIYRYYRFQEKLAEKPEKFADKDPWGAEPIFYDENVLESVQSLLENRASNEGYFQNEAEWTLDTNQSAQTISADYVLEVGRPYRIDSVRQYWRDSAVARIIDSLQPETRLRKGERYELDALKAERQRWQKALREAGYYYFREDDFFFLADTVAGDHEVDLLVKLKDETPPNHLQPQRIAAVNIYPNADSQDQTARYGPNDTIKVGGLNVLCEDCPLRPAIVDEAFEQKAGALYHPTDHRKTLQRLADYNTFRYIAMNYEQVPGTDSALVLNAYLQPRLRRRFEGELGISYNSADYFGPNVKLAYLNRNLLRGAELFKLEGDFTLAQFLGEKGDARVPNSSIYGLTASLKVPRLWMPKRRKLIPRVYTSGTVMELGGKVESLNLNLGQFADEIAEENLDELADLVEADPEAGERLSLQQFRFQFGYTWKRRIANNHALNPISIRFQNPSVSNRQVLDLAQRANLAPGTQAAQNNRFDRMLVFSPNYTYTLDTRLRGLGTHSFFWQQKGSFNVNNVFPVGSNAELREREVSLYPMLESDFRYYLTLNQQNQVAFRFHGGIAFPLFSERAIVPYFDLFSIGGPNSLRGFGPRQLGPGRTVPRRNNLLTAGGFGNLVLETSLEYRFRFNELVELALFADAGNLWTYETETEELETDFRSDTFLDELAVDAGLGVRFDLQFLIFRIDVAKPLIIPYEEAAQSVEFEVPSDGFRLVVAFGYPF